MAIVALGATYVYRLVDAHRYAEQRPDELSRATHEVVAATGGAAGAVQSQAA